MNSPQYIDLSEKGIKVTDIRIFRTLRGRGPRRMNQPYWVVSEAGTYVFNFINEQTNVEELSELVGNGRVYVRVQDLELYGNYDKD